MLQSTSPSASPATSPAGDGRRRKDGEGVGRVVLAIRDLILTGELLPGEPVRQEQMAERLNVSRVPIREALHVLAEQDMLEHRPRHGYYVAKRAPMELAQVALMLDLLEPELMRTLEWPDAATLDRLRQLNAEMAAHVDEWEWAPLLALNEQFHFLIFSLSPYKLVLREVERLWSLANPFIAQKLAFTEARRLTVEEHERLIEALELRDRKLCVTTLDDHRRSSRSGIVPVLPAPKDRPSPKRQKEPS
jgi:DNA-binding GntR family transcriptional regulator